MAFHRRRMSNDDGFNLRSEPIQHKRQNFSFLKYAKEKEKRKEGEEERKKKRAAGEGAEEEDMEMGNVKDTSNNKRKFDKVDYSQKDKHRDDLDAEKEPDSALCIADAESLFNFKQQLEINKRQKISGSQKQDIESQIEEEELREFQSLEASLRGTVDKGDTDRAEREVGGEASPTPLLLPTTTSHPPTLASHAQPPPTPLAPPPQNKESLAHSLLIDAPGTSDMVVRPCGTKEKEAEETEKKEKEEKEPIPMPLDDGESDSEDENEEERRKNEWRALQRSKITVPDDDQKLFEAMFGDEKASVALREALTNDFVGVDGLSGVKDIQALAGKSIHNPKDAQLPNFRPRLFPRQFFRGVDGETQLKIGVKEVFWRKLWPFRGRKRMHELWLYGVLPGCQSIDLKINGFFPYLYVLIGEEADGWDDLRRRSKLHGDLNAALSLSNEQLMKEKGAENMRYQKGDLEIVHSVELVRRIPFVGYTEERRDYLLKITYRNMSDRDALVKYIAEDLDMRLIHHNWDLDQLFLHSTQQQSPLEVSFDHPDAWKDIDRADAVRLARWVKIRLMDIDFYENESQHVTTGQLCGTVHWKKIVPDPTCEQTIPMLLTYFDGEMLAQKMYDTGVNSFPRATNKRDKLISITFLFFVPGYSTKGSFLRVVMGIGRSYPIPGVLTLTYDTERDLLLAIQDLIVVRNDVDVFAGWNSLDFDGPYIFERAKVLGIDGQFNRWNRYLRDKVRLPRPDSSFQNIDIKGRWQLDLMIIAKKRYATFPTYTLRFVADKLVKSGVNKVDMPYELLPIYFHDGGERGKAMIHFYCTVDAVLCCLTDMQQNFTISYLEVSRESNTKFMDLMTRGTQVVIENSRNRELHHYRWYENKHLMSESECYSEPVPKDWDGWSENNHLHQLFAMASDVGDIEPPSGFVCGDPRAEWRDNHWRRVLERSYDLGKQYDDRWKSLTPAQQKQQRDQYIKCLMYEDDKERKKTTNKKKKAALKNQQELTTYLNTNESDDEEEEDESEGEDSVDEDGNRIFIRGKKEKKVKRERKAASIVQIDKSTLDKVDSKGNLAGANSFSDAATLKDQTGLKLGDPGHVRRVFPGDTSFGYETNCGGNVFRSLKGVWDELFKILDFKSLYPSIMRALQVCYSSLVWEKRYFNRSKCRRIAHGGRFYYIHICDPHRLNATEHLRRLKAGEPIPKPEVHTVIPGIVARWINNRVAIKALMKAEKDPHKKSALDAQQAAAKVLANSIYGSLKVNARPGVREKEEKKRAAKLKGCRTLTSMLKKEERKVVLSVAEQQRADELEKRKARFAKNAHIVKFLSCAPLAYYVTSSGRIMIQLVKYVAEKKYDCLMIYGDTDSVMVTCPKLLKIRHSGRPNAEREYERAFEDVGNKVVEWANGFFLYPNELEDENTVKRAYFLKKKMYAYWAHRFAKGKKDELGYRIMLPETDITTKGMKYKKRDTCKSVANLCAAANNHISLNELEPVFKLLNEWVVKLARNEHPLEELAISGKYTHKLKDKDDLVQYMFKKEKKRRGIQLHDGDRLMFIVRKAKPHEKPFMRGECLEYALQQSFEVDIEYYLEKQLCTPLSSIIETHMEPERVMDQLRRLMMKHYKELKASEGHKRLFNL